MRQGRGPARCAAPDIKRSVPEYALTELSGPAPAPPTVRHREVIEDHDGSGFDDDLGLRIDEGEAVPLEEIELRVEALELVAAEEVRVGPDARQLRRAAGRALDDPREASLGIALDVVAAAVNLAVGDQSREQLVAIGPGSLSEKRAEGNEARVGGAGRAVDRDMERGVAGYVGGSDGVDGQTEIEVQGLEVAAGWTRDRGDDKVADNLERGEARFGRQLGEHGGGRIEGFVNRGESAAKHRETGPQ